MRLLPCSPEHPDCSPHGPFRLVPDAGWELLQTFIDAGSGLLIASTSCADQSRWIDHGFGSRTIPTRTHVVDLASLTILSPEQWRARFDYREHRRRSEDGTLELVWRRVPAQGRDGDLIEEELFEVASGKLVCRSSSVGFRDAPREDLLDAHLRSQSEAAERQRALDATPTRACPHCGAMVRYSPRYPRAICAACCEREIVDAQGRKVTFGNVGFCGGLRICYWQDGEISHDDCSQIECACFIDGKPYVATEARFGGVVIQARR